MYSKMPNKVFIHLIYPVILLFMIATAFNVHTLSREWSFLDNASSIKIPGIKSLHNFLWLSFVGQFILLATAISLLILSIMLLKKCYKSIEKNFITKICSLEDQLSEEKNSRNKFQQLYEKLSSIDIMRTDFFSNISHELKTPLCIILGAIKILDGHQKDEQWDRVKNKKYLVSIKHNCYRLLRLINNVLDINRIDAGYINLNMTNCNIVYLIEDLVQTIIPFAQQSLIIVEFDTEEEEIITAVDVDKIERIILNLMSNAIKFTPVSGKVSVNVSRNTDFVKIAVSDTGVGIPYEKQEVIFDRFRQANSTLTRQAEGAGIGLSLVKSFTELHGGTISVSSSEGVGSTFIIDLPIRICEEQPLDNTCCKKEQSKIIEAINIEFSDIYHNSAC